MNESKIQKGRFEQMIREMAVAFCRVTGVEPTPDQIKTVELQIRHQFAGERVYVAGHPKAQHAEAVRRMVRDARHTQREQARALGMSERGLRKALRGR